MNETDKDIKLKDISFDAVFDDVFGLNIRSFKSLWQSFKSPKPYFRSAFSLDWENRFTPAFRLWFSLITITFFLQFIWAGSNSGTLQSAINQIEAIGSIPDQFSAEKIAKEYLRWTYGLLPFILAFCLFILASIYKAWGEKLSFAVRQRKLFITILPSTFITIFTTMATGFTTDKQLLNIAVLSYFINFILDSLTAYRGAFHVTTFVGKLWRSFTLSVLTFVTSIIAGGLSGILGLLVVLEKYGGF